MIGTVGTDAVQSVFGRPFALMRGIEYSWMAAMAFYGSMVVSFVAKTGKNPQKIQFRDKRVIQNLSIITFES